MLEDFEFDTPDERRRHPRTDALSIVQVTLLSADVLGRLQEVSAGGCAIATAEIPGKGAHRLRLACAGIPPVEVSAELVHVTRVALPGAPSFYLAGFEFLNPDRPTADALGRLIERVAALCSA